MKPVTRYEASTFMLVIRFKLDCIIVFLNLVKFLIFS